MISFDKNFRQMCKSKDGRFTIFRSSNPHSFTDDTQKCLVNMFKIKTIIDMRNKSEREKDRNDDYIYSAFDVYEEEEKPTEWKKVQSAPKPIDEDKEYRIYRIVTADRDTYQHLLNDLQQTTNAIDLLSMMYRFLLEIESKSIRLIFNICQESEHYPILIHCSYGKDRTGLMAALLCDVIGISRQRIAADYGMTRSLMSPETIESMRKEITKSKFPEEGLASPKEVITNTFSYLLEKYGTVSNYLVSTGVTDFELNDLYLMFNGPLTVTRVQVTVANAE